MQNISRDFLPICSASYLADSSLAIAIADCHFDSGLDHVTSHVATKLLLACAPLAM